MKNKKCLFAFILVCSVILTSCGLLSNETSQAKVVIRMPQVSASSSNNRSISPDRVAPLKKATARYSVTLNGVPAQDSGGGLFKATVPVGRATVVVTCYSEFGLAIVRVEKTVTLVPGNNNISISIANDGNEVPLSANIRALIGTWDVDSNDRQRLEADVKADAMQYRKPNYCVTQLVIKDDFTGDFKIYVSEDGSQGNEMELPGMWTYDGVNLGIEVSIAGTPAKMAAKLTIQQGGQNAEAVTPLGTYMYNKTN